MLQFLSDNWKINVDSPKMVVAKANLKRLTYEEQSILLDFLKLKSHSSLQEVADVLRQAAFGGGGPVFQPFVAVALQSFHNMLPYIAQQTVPIRPVHGPFSAEVYEDKLFVETYTKARYLSRVAEVKAILASLGNVHVIAPGDGVGVAYQAARQLQAQGHAITVESYDSSAEMCALAHKFGNVVERKSIIDTLKESRSAIYFLSHVTDYMTEDELVAYSQVKTVIYGRAVTFPGCVNYVPYDRDWGYQLCTSNVRMAGVYIPMALRIVPTIDYTVFSHISTIEAKMIDIDEEFPMYRQEAVNLGLEISQAAEVVVSTKIEDKRKIVAVPAVGIVGGAWGGHMLTVCPPMLVQFAGFHRMPFFLNPVYIGYKFFFAGEAVRVDDGVRTVLLQPRVVGNHKFYNIPKKLRKGCVQMDGCTCYGKSPHFHLLKIASPRKVIWQNLVIKTRNLNQGKCNRVLLYTTYASSCGADTVEIDARYFAMERANEVSYVSQEKTYLFTED